MARGGQWPPWEVTSLRLKLNELADIVREATDMDEDVLAWMSRMLVVRSSGFVEQVATEVCRGHVQLKSGGMPRSFALSWLENSRNPSPENLMDLLGRFDGVLQEEFETLLDSDDQRVRRELSFMVDRRNRIAHGLNESVNRPKALALKDVAEEVADWLILRLNPDRARAELRVTTKV